MGRTMLPLGYRRAASGVAVASRVLSSYSDSHEYGSAGLGGAGVVRRKKPHPHAHPYRSCSGRQQCFLLVWSPALPLSHAILTDRIRAHSVMHFAAIEASGLTILLVTCNTRRPPPDLPACWLDARFMRLRSSASSVVRLMSVTPADLQATACNGQPHAQPPWCGSRDRCTS
jgi:hypothetical protein